MKVKIVLLLLLMCSLGRQSFGQKKQGQQLYIVYVDNSLPTGDGLTGAMMEDLYAMMDTVKEKKFLLFLSNGKKPQMTVNAKTATGFMDGLSGKNGNTAFPDQNEDVTVLRQKVAETVKDFKGELVFTFYVTNKFVASLQDKYSPLVGLLPKEFVYLYSDNFTRATVQVKFPKMAYSRVNVNDVQSILGFTAEGNGNAGKVTYSLSEF